VRFSVQPALREPRAWKTNPEPRYAAGGAFWIEERPGQTRILQPPAPADEPHFMTRVPLARWYPGEFKAVAIPPLIQRQQRSDPFQEPNACCEHKSGERGCIVSG
jgi:hypothetical protein